MIRKPKKTAREKLLATFWWLVREGENAGVMTKENAYDMVERLYKVRSLRKLTTDELARAIDEISECSGIPIRKPLHPWTPGRNQARKESHRNIITVGGGIVELPTREQMTIIEFYADKMHMRDETLKNMMKRITGARLFDVMAARTLTEALKAMYARGWRDKPVPQLKGQHAYH